MAKHKVIETGNAKMSLHITIKCNGKKTFRVWAEDYGKPNSRYADRTITVEGERTIYFSFPVSPRSLFIGCVNTGNVTDEDFSFEVEKKELKTYNVWLDEETRDFLKLAIYFSQVCGFERPTEKGRLFTTDDGQFNIKYFPIIKDFSTGKMLGTPARIGHNSGIIEVAACRFDKYTIPMRMAILLHEFSHKYKNPKMNLDISNEIGADINALYIYLGLGFSKVDAIYVFANVFLKAQTPSNMDRMRKLMDYIQKFENQQFAKLN